MKVDKKEDFPSALAKVSYGRKEGMRSGPSFSKEDTAIIFTR